jgi:hypothetical protein
MERHDTPPLGGAEEGVLEFVIFLDDEHNDISSATKVAAGVHSFVKEASAGYIWHVQPFGLHVVRPDEPCGLQQRLRRPCLAGSMAFGDNVEDEWLATWLLTEVSRRFAAAGAVVRVSDNDGDFLLIEVAEHLPRWVHPEQMEHRVFIHDGELKLIPFEGADRRDASGAPGAASCRAGVGNADSSRGIPGRIPTAEAGAAWVRELAAAARAPASMREALSVRLSGYPQRALRNMHCAAVYLPPRAAAVLSAAPQLIAPAVEAFYSRDSSEVSRAARLQHVLGPAVVAATSSIVTVSAGPAAAHTAGRAAAPTGSPAAASPASANHAAAVPVATAPGGLVSMSVPMSRHLFAQLVQQRFHPPKAYAPLMPPRPRAPVSAQPTGRTEAADGASGAAAGAAAGTAAGTSSDGAMAAAVQEYARYDLGCKIATGLEILLARGAGAKEFQAIMTTATLAQPAGAAAGGASRSTAGASPTAPAGAASLAAAVAPPLRDSAGFKAYLAALTRRGYFEGARSRAEHEAKAEAALGFYTKTQQQPTGAAAADAVAAAADTKAGGAAADDATASASPPSVPTPPDALSRLSALLQTGVSRSDALGTEPAGSPSARLGRLLAHVALALPQLQAAGAPGAPSATRGAGPSTAGSAVIGSALPFAWPPRCDRDDDASWLFRADDTAMLDREMDKFMRPAGARAGAAEEALPLAGGSASAGRLPPHGAAGIAAAGAVVAAHPKQASKQPKADGPVAVGGSGSGSGEAGDAGDMSELRGLLSALSSFVKSTSSFEGADTAARRRPATGASTAAGPSLRSLGGSTGGGEVDDEDSTDEADDDAATEGNAEDGRDSEDAGSDDDADTKDSAAPRAKEGAAGGAGVAAQATPAFEPGFDAERFMREVRAHLALRKAAPAASAGLQQGGGASAAGAAPSARTVHFAEPSEPQSREHGPAGVADVVIAAACDESDAALDDDEDDDAMLSVAAWEPEEEAAAAEGGSDASEAANAATASRVGASGSSPLSADEEGAIDDASLRSLMASMEAELYGGAGSTLGASFLRVDGPAGAAGRTAGAGCTPGAGVGADGVGGSSAAPLSDADMQFNLLASLSQSVAGQGGRAGPASNMLGDLGLTVPAAWWEAEGRRAAAEDGDSGSDSDDEAGDDSASPRDVHRAMASPTAGAGQAAAGHSGAHTQTSAAATGATGVATVSKAPSPRSVPAAAPDQGVAPTAPSTVPPSAPQLTAEERARVLASLAEWD